MSPRQFGFWLFLASLVVLFGASLVAYFVTRANSAQWTDIRHLLPPGLPLATLFALGVSVALHRAYLAIRQNKNQALILNSNLALASALTFLLLQAYNWKHLTSGIAEGNSGRIALFTFYLLTGLHALHVLGGLVPIGIVLRRARQREYSSSRCSGVKYCAQYWHFLGVVWLVMLCTLYLAG